MNPIIMKIVTTVLAQMPSIASAVEDAVKTAETPEAGQAKAKELLADALKVLGVIVDAL